MSKFKTDYYYNIFHNFKYEPRKIWSTIKCAKSDTKSINRNISLKSNVTITIISDLRVVVSEFNTFLGEVGKKKTC